MNNTIHGKRKSATTTRLTVTAMLTAALLLSSTACNTLANNSNESTVDPAGSDDPSMIMDTDLNVDN